MARSARLVVPGLPHHVTQRGNNGAEVFFGDDDRRQYLLWLAEYASKYELKVWAYCLMSNHVHLVVVPTTEHALSSTLRALQMRYANRINNQRDTTGHLWQSRFYSCTLDDQHLQAAVRYVERNPVRAGLGSRAEDYMWSSARPHCGLRRDPVLAHDLPLLDMVADWSFWLSEPEDEAITIALRGNTMKGKPCGDGNFIERLETLTGRDLSTKRLGD